MLMAELDRVEKAPREAICKNLKGSVDEKYSLD
jgi:hypothetical protein